MSKSNVYDLCGLGSQREPDGQVIELLDRGAPKVKVVDGEVHTISKGKILKTAANVRRVLLNDSYYQSLRYNEHTNTVEYLGKSIVDVGITDMRVDLDERYQTGCQKKDFEDMAIWVAHQRSYDPLIDYLDSCVARHSHKSCVKGNLKALRGLFGSTKDSLVKVVTTSTSKSGELVDYSQLLCHMSVCWAVSAIARARASDDTAGVKVDTCLVLVGKQGAYKSSLIKALASDKFFSDSHLPIGNKDGYQLIHSSGVWVWELGELHSLRGKSAENTKMYLSAQSDLYRPTHARFPVRKNRRLVFTATTNDFTFLSDPTGNRRFWPVLIDGYGINLEAVAKIRDRYWAEAQALYDIILRGRNKGKLLKAEQVLFDEFGGWWLNDKMSDRLRSYQDRFYLDDPWVSTVRELVNSRYLSSGRIGTTIEEIMTELELPVTSQHSGYARRIADILRKEGAERVQTTIGSKKVRFWQLPQNKPVSTKGESK